LESLFALNQRLGFFLGSQIIVSSDYFSAPDFHLLKHIHSAIFTETTNQPTLKKAFCSWLNLTNACPTWAWVTRFMPLMGFRLLEPLIILLGVVVGPISLPI